MAGARLEQDPVLRDHVLTRLEAHWSPEREAGRQVISYESIYRFIDGQLRRPKNTGGAQSPLSTRYRKLQWTVDAETRTL